MAMAVLAALSLMVAGCGGKEEAKKAETAKYVANKRPIKK